MSKPTIKQNAAREPIYWIIRRDSDGKTLCQVGKKIFWSHKDWQWHDLFKRYKTLGWATKRVEKIQKRDGTLLEYTGESYTCIAIYEGDSFLPGGFVVRKEWGQDFIPRVSISDSVCVDTPGGVGVLRAGSKENRGEVKAVHYKQGLASFIK